FEKYPLSELLGYIDWMPFFNAWELTGKFPDVLTDAKFGEAASNLYADARRMVKQLIAEKWLEARAVVGLFPANAVGDDVEIYADEERGRPLVTLSFLRQQKGKPPSQPHECLAEAAAEHFHERVRRELWGYAAEESLTNDQLIREEYRGIRPAPGYPSCPDHT